MWINKCNWRPKNKLTHFQSTDSQQKCQENSIGKKILSINVINTIFIFRNINLDTYLTPCCSQRLTWEIDQRPRVKSKPIKLFRKKKEKKIMIWGRAMISRYISKPQVMQGKKIGKMDSKFTTSVIQKTPSRREKICTEWEKY